MPDTIDHKSSDGLNKHSLNFFKVFKSYPMFFAYLCNDKLHVVSIHLPIMQENNKQRALDCRYLRMASIWAENSYCQRRKVGAIIVKNDMIISDGFNGTPSGFENVCEDSAGLTKPYVLHAEANAITKVARSNNSSDGATLYITASPCMECSKLIIQAGIKRVVYNELYRITDGIDLLQRAGVECVHIPELTV